MTSLLASLWRSFNQKQGSLCNSSSDHITFCSVGTVNKIALNQKGISGYTNCGLVIP